MLMVSLQKKQRSLRGKSSSASLSSGERRRKRKWWRYRLAAGKKLRKRTNAARLKVVNNTAATNQATASETLTSATLPTFDQGYNTGYDKGYDTGLVQGLSKGLNQGEKDGYNKGLNIGYQNGKHDGGDAIVDRYLPEYQILPELSVEQIIAAGIEKLSPQFHHLLTAQELGERITQALHERTPFSLVRLGDGELLTLAQETIMTIEQIKEEGTFLPYAGVTVPDLEVKRELVQAIRGATVVGIPKLRVRNFQPLAFSVFKAENIDYRGLTLTDSLVNYYLYQSGYLSQITQGRRVLLVGNLAPQLAGVLRDHNVAVAGEVAPVQGVSDIARIKSIIVQHDFDVALVSAGISAVILSVWIASEMGKVAIDFGHLADSIVKGEAPYR